MSNSRTPESREERYGKTERKNLTLTTESIRLVQDYANRHGLYFSVAIETLALIGLNNTMAESLPRLLSNLLERLIRQQFNRFAKLLSYTAIAAAEANYKTDVVLLQMIWREARQNPDSFWEELLVSSDPTKEPDAVVRQIRDGICTDAHDQAVKRLRKPLAENHHLWQEGGTDE